LTKRARANLMSRTAREINRLLIREKNLGRLLQKVCDTLVENASYKNVWLVILDQSGQVSETAKAGLTDDAETLTAVLKRDPFPLCIQNALLQPRVHTIEEPFSDCAGCFLVDKHKGMSVMSARMERGGNTYGVLAAALPKNLVYDLDEQRIFNEITEDIAFGLRTRILEKEKTAA